MILGRALGRLAAAVMAAAGLAACGLGAGASAGSARLTVTAQFGTRTLGTVAEAHAPGAETVMRMLERHFRVRTRYGGGFVQSIDGLSGGAQRDWFYYVNGVEAAVGAADTALHRGDAVWWDFHDWRATETIPAVVGAFPEPFLHGLGGRRYATVLECAQPRSRPCALVAGALRRAGVSPTRRALGAAAGARALTVLVGSWPALHGLAAPALLARGPAASGVYARFAGAGGSAPGALRLEVLGPTGRVARTLGAGAGLVAATATAGRPPAWIITGTDATGVSAAARLLAPARLHDRFALAAQGSRALAVPLEAAQ